MRTKEIYLFSKWTPNNDGYLHAIKSNNLVPNFILGRFVGLVERPRTISDGFLNTFKLGRIGCKAIAYDYFLETNLDNLNKGQILAIDSFWIGFTAGREFRKNNGSI